MLDKILTAFRKTDAPSPHAVIVTVGLIAMTIFSAPNQMALQATALAVVLWLCLAFFALEWLMHAWTAHGDGRLRGYCLSSACVIDALAVLPVPLALLLGVLPYTAWLFASLWLFKLATVTPGLARLGRVFLLEARPLTSVLVLFVLVLVFAAMALHLLEGDVQPTTFGSIPQALWWAVTTLTTTGYGDAVPSTPLGRVVAGLVMICGLGVFGLLTGILATGFVEDSRRHSFLQNWNLVRHVPFFRRLEPAGLIELARMMRQWEVAEGTVIVRRGREGDCMYFVAAGEVEVDVSPPVRLGTGAFFGEMALLGSGLRAATVTAISPATLLVLDAADFRTAAAHHPALADAIEKEAGRRGGARQKLPKRRSPETKRR